MYYCGATCALPQGDSRPERVTIFTDVQAAIRRMASEEPSPGQISRSRRGGTSRRYGGARPGIIIEVRTDTLQYYNSGRHGVRSPQPLLAHYPRAPYA
jgi:hypothetical protein